MVNYGLPTNTFLRASAIAWVLVNAGPWEWSKPSHSKLAHFSFILLEGKEESVAPLAVLGAANAQIDPGAITLLEGKHVRLFPHLDPPGRRAARAWAQQLVDAGCKVDAFDLSDCVRADG